MELDKRIKDTGSILTCFSPEAATEHMGQKGYFTNSIDDYQSLEQFTDFRTVSEVTDDDTPFCTGQRCYQFFLPAEFVRPAEEKKKWRPYSLMEFEDKFTIGRPIRFREKDKTGLERYLILNGYAKAQYSTGTTDYIHIGSTPYTLKELFEDYEWLSQDTEDFEPFGVEE